MEKIKKSVSNEYDRLLNIGNAMFAYYDGKVLSYDQIELIAGASNDDKVQGMNIAVEDRLRLKYSYSTYQRNSDAISSARILKRKK